MSTKHDQKACRTGSTTNHPAHFQLENFADFPLENLVDSQLEISVDSQLQESPADYQLRTHYLMGQPTLQEWALLLAFFHYLFRFVSRSFARLCLNFSCILAWSLACGLGWRSWRRGSAGGTRGGGGAGAGAATTGAAGAWSTISYMTTTYAHSEVSDLPMSPKADVRCI